MLPRSVTILFLLMYLCPNPLSSSPGRPVLRSSAEDNAEELLVSASSITITSLLSLAPEEEVNQQAYVSLGEGFSEAKKGKCMKLDEHRACQRVQQCFSGAALCNCDICPENLPIK
ncbi:hypothetical protein OE88DRAFT_844085 [Heliocybe sulcata]|uniref:Uncharacterized protein n=1 Tax=Heliocybe sulcata TaxID=5364 RepID=A0A5C3MNM2_9AGAM|nr:hypothetical protein OE88DRAFT_844085 [Heliocybe sulcata]